MAPEAPLILAPLSSGASGATNFGATPACHTVSSEVRIYTRGASGAFDEDTIFRVMVNETLRVVHFKVSNPAPS